MTESPELARADRVGLLASISIDCPDPAALAPFYTALLGMPVVLEVGGGQVVSLSDGRIHVSLMRVDDYVAPTWPDPGQLQQMHLDIAVTDVQGAVDRALALGATEAGHQPSPDSWRVMRDPVGHPFCLTNVGIDALPSD